MCDGVCVQCLVHVSVACVFESVCYLCMLEARELVAVDENVRWDVCAVLCTRECGGICVLVYVLESVCYLCMLRMSLRVHNTPTRC